MKFPITLLLITCCLASLAQPQDSIHFTMNKLPNIDQLIDMTLNADDAAKLRTYFHQRLQQAGDTMTLSEKDEIYNQEVIDFIAEQQILFYGHFDWKQDSRSLDWYVKNTIKKNFDSTGVFESGCDLKELDMVYKAVKCYASTVRKAGFLLCYMDIGSDSYQLFLINPKDYERLKMLVANIGFNIKDEAVEW